MTEIPGVMCERDVACVLRDGTTIYADIYRPANTTEKVPVICVFAPFGKNPSEGMDSWQLMGVPPKTVSQYAKFEAPRPRLLVPLRLRRGQRGPARRRQLRGRRLPLGLPGRPGRL